MKKIFRFFRGELNGFYINTLCTFLNTYLFVTGLLDELIYQLLFQWITPEQATDLKLAMRDEDIMGLIKIGGITDTYGQGRTSLGSIRFTSSNVVNNRERSERYFFNMTYELALPVSSRLAHDNYDTDINVLANENERTTYVEPGATILGYVKEGVNLFDEDGNIINENITQTPPTGAAYIVWYGPKYLTYEYFYTSILPLDVEEYMLLFESVQIIRRNGASIVELLNITQLLCKGYVHNINIVQNKYWYDCFYDLDEDILLEGRERRYNAWLEVGKMKFKYFNFINNATITGGGDDG